MTSVAWKCIGGTLLVGGLSLVATATESPTGYLPGGRVLLDAHNAYPSRGQWSDRLERALATGLPLAIEQDLAWCPSGAAGHQPVVTHEDTCEGGEPTLRDFFFERIRPVMEGALAHGPSPGWPLVTLNLDFKTNEPAHHRAVWRLLGEFEAWLSTARRPAALSTVSPITPGPLLVLTGSHGLQERTFAGDVPVGERLRLFGAVESPSDPDGGPPDPPAASAYRRWWNHPWRVVETGGPPGAGDWTPADAARLRAIVGAGHAAGLWVRFYTLNGHAPGDSRGWSAGYNFGSRSAVEARWRAAIDAGVDFVATDQYEALAELVGAGRGR
jgi:hypothetical protein